MSTIWLTNVLETFILKMTVKFELQQFEGDPNLFVILENGISVLHADANRFGIRKEEKRELIRMVRAAAKTIRTDGIGSLESLVQEGVLKRIEREESVKHLNVWEVRSDAHAARIFFLLANPNAIIVSAVNKTHHSQSQAINRGVKRWKLLLKECEKKG